MSRISKEPESVNNSSEKQSSKKKLEEYNQSKPPQLKFFELTKPEQKQYSNTIELYDAIPKYYWGKQDADVQNIKAIKRTFVHFNEEYKVTIQPAIIENKNGEFQTVYPGKREELIEDVLRKIASEGDGVFLDSGNEKPSASVLFTLYQVQQELKKQGHTHSIVQIKESIQICGQANIKLETLDGKSLLISNFFETVGLQTKDDWNEHGNKTKGFIKFNSLVTKSIVQKTFRLINYKKFMSYTSVTAKWLHKRLSHNYIQASSGDPYNINLSTILRDSGIKRQGLLGGNIRDVKDALEEMVEKEVIEKYSILKVFEKRKVIDAKFTIWPNSSFINEMKYANKRHKEMREEENKQFNLKKIKEIQSMLENKTSKPKD